MYRLAISYQHSLGFVSTPDHASLEQQLVELPLDIMTSFQSSLELGLTEISSAKWHSQIATWPAEFSFWRSFCRKYFESLCRQYTSTQRAWSSPEPPDSKSIDELLRTAPPMQGLEYLDETVCLKVWKSLDEFTERRIATLKQNLSDYLKSLDASWNLVGRVTFHLAENKKNQNAPFAFMATYTLSQSTSGAPQHLPLSEALRQSISTKDTATLERLLEPVTLASQSSTLIADLLTTRRIFAPQAWGLKQAYEFLTQVPLMEQAGVVVRVPNWWNATRPPRPQVNVRLGTKEPNQLNAEAIDLQVNVTIDGESLNKEELDELLAARERLVLMRGKWIQVDTEQLQNALAHWNSLQRDHLSGVDFLEGMRLLSGATIGHDSEDEELRNWTRVEAGPWLRGVLDTLRSPSGQLNVAPEAGIKATLRTYQIDGVRWLWFATQLGIGVCLADDMGLGKTLQIISLLAQLQRQQQEVGAATTPSLLIVPTSLLGNWQREVAKFAPQLNLFVAHRSAHSEDELKRVKEDPETQLADFDVVVTTYGMVRTSDWLKKFKWRLLILDEAQAIKNAGSNQTKAIKNIPAQSRITLTGTPIENQLGDLWSLFDFSSPGLLGSAKDFKKFVSSKEENVRLRKLASLRALIRPYILRRLKTDPTIISDLPSKTEVRVDCSLSTVQSRLYTEVINDLKKVLDAATGIQRRGVVLSTLMQLKQICNHPSLYLKQANFKASDSGKYAELARLCETIRERQEKVLVFSQFQSMCEPLNEFLLEQFAQPGFVITGKTSAKARNEMVAEFQKPFGPPYFVISVKAGGTGLNLTEACHVIHFDRWWNPAVEDQATDRAFRIGQTRNVLVHKFVCQGTLEERIADLIHSKRNISHEIFEESGDVKLTEMSNEELLRFVALDISKASE